MVLGKGIYTRSHNHPAAGHRKKQKQKQETCIRKKVMNKSSRNYTKKEPAKKSCNTKETLTL